MVPGMIGKDDGSGEGTDVASGPAGVLRHIDRLWNLGTVAGMTDAELLAQLRSPATSRCLHDLPFGGFSQRKDMQDHDAD